MKKKKYLVLLISLLYLLNCEENGKMNDDFFKQERSDMVKKQLIMRGIQNKKVLNTMETVKRHLFVPKSEVRYAYKDYPLPIGYGQTISQPYIVAFMTEKLDPQANDRVLEIGTGSGYQAAILAEIVAEVYTIEIVTELCERAKKQLKALNYNNVTVICGDGYRGYKKMAPYDKIIVTAAPKKIPEPLIEQLKVSGKLIIPVGDLFQELLLVEKTDKKVITRKILPVRFVPLVDEKGKQY